MNNIKSLRTSRGMTQKQLASLCGVHQTAVSQWEKGRTDPDKNSIVTLSEIFNVSADTIMGLESHAEKKNLIPVLGYVRAGIPIEAVQEILDYEEISESAAASGEHFALRITGDSMEPKFSDGDVVIVRKQTQVDNGQIAVVLVNGNDATVKKFYRTENGIKLVSTNPTYDPFFFTPDEVNSLPVQVIGRVVELRAKF